MLLLFLLSAILPVGALSVVVYAIVSREFAQQTDNHLRMATDLSTQGLLGRLHAAETELRVLALRSEHARSGEVLDAKKTNTFHQVAIAVGQSPAAPTSLTPLSDDEVARLRSGASLLRLQEHPDSAPGVLLAVPDSSRSTVAWGQLNPMYLWSTGVDDDGLTGGPSCVFTGQAFRVIHCNEDNAGPIQDLLRAEAAHTGQVRLDWESTGARYAGLAQQVFLRAGYGTDPWWLVIGIDRAQEAHGASAFTRTFAITIALAIVVAFLLSNVQIRRSLEPLARLTAATSRLGDGDFTHRVQVKSNDEFAELGRSFNRMTADLQGHFALLRAMTTIDRASLGGHGADHLADAVAEQCMELFQTDGIAIGFAGLERQEPWTTVTVHHPREQLPQRLLSPGPADLALLSGDTPFWYFDDPATPSMFQANGNQSVTSPRLIVPLRQADELLGFLALSQPRAGGVALDDAVPEQLIRQIEMGVTNRRAVERLERLTLSTLETLARTIDASSPWTAGHSERVTHYSINLGRELKLPSDEMTTLHRGALLHDIGKIAVPATILDSPNPLSESELTVVRSHPVVGARILEPIRAYAPAIPVVLHHHERFDGNGYPHGLAAEAIPYLARIAAVADVYDALTSDRPYRAGWSRCDAIAYIREGALVQFDPDVVAALLQVAARHEWDASVSSRTLSVS